MRAELENKLNQVYNYLRTYIDENNYPPSVREICSSVGIKSTATVYDYLEKLKNRGLITKHADKKRAYSLTETDGHFAKFERAPYIGQITAGQPILAVENFEGYYPLPNEFNNSNNDLFILNVNGQSMIEAGIHDGDKIIVRKQSNADNGDIVVAMIDDSATVKRFFKRNNKIVLHPENSNMTDLIFDDVIVIGKVIGLYRKF